MYYFVPSWYLGDQSWDESHLSYDQLFFDDTINQMRIFHEAGETIELLLLNYMPHLRNRLHDQVLDRIPYWSVFDAVQGFEDAPSQALLLEDLVWPGRIQFVPTPFAMLAYLEGEHYADINYSSEGWIHDVVFYKDRCKEKNLVFDDRGYLSSAYYYNAKEHLVRHDFFNSSGQRILSHDYQTGQVTSWSDRFPRVFDTMTHFIRAQVTDYFSDHLSQKDVLVIANDKQHDDLLLAAGPKGKKVYSIFSRRPLDKKSNLLDQADLVIVDSEASQGILRDSDSKQAENILNLTPFDTRLQLGLSQRVKALRVFYQLDGVTDSQVQEFLELMLKKIKADRRIEVILAGFRLSYEREGVLKDIVQTFEEKTHPVQQEVEDFEDKLPDDEQLPAFQLRNLQTDKDLIQEFQTTRLVIDLAKTPNLYTQIAAISAGIPQINQVTTAYVDHKKNGWIAKNRDQLSEGIDYYLQGLKHWNEALVYAVDKINRYHGNEIVEAWQAYLGEKTSDKSIADRNK
ncbi:accessory Sec system protein Asp1 [Aerococcus sp. HMSC06H08]|uniref:accessory Sec system protein Asp1 n=1 Tax=Aerococcus sp. HMSC06H08 TaxID=1581129 RepID=UPI0008A1CF07|nr:accessory Sec system protein Asp1 [Aerococcus sp. HMSC06H08]OFT42085.1 hypothetical protein HMPREF3161_02845 [Aerococcus sp. HMSC06H08]